MTSAIIKQKATIDLYGNIRVHGAEGLDMPLSRKLLDGTLKDISNDELFFIIHFSDSDIQEFELAAGNSTTERRIRVSIAELSPAVLEESYPYALVDRTGPVPDVRMEGKIKVGGFRE